MTKLFLPLALAALIFPPALFAAPSATAEKEYQQVRTIALRDARVQAAYRDADRRLDEKIVRIDPALEPYVRSRQAARDGVPAPKPAAGASAHVVARGETLGAIAAKYHVSVAALKSANHIQDERKLRVGQSLAIPSGKGSPRRAHEEGSWSHLMH